MRSWARGLALCEDLLAVTTCHGSRCVGVQSTVDVDTPEAGAPCGNPGLVRKNRSGEGQCLAGDRQLLVGRVDDEGDGRVGSGHDARLLDAALVGLDVDLDAEGGEGLGQLAAHVVVVLADAGGEGDDGTTQLWEGCVSVSYSLVKSEEAISMSPIKQ